jgi:glycosyltransferase involved in cell wall biosynthesis
VVGREVTFAVPGHLQTPTGGYAYDREIVAQLRSLRWNLRVLDIGEDFPFPDREGRRSALALLDEIPDRALVVVDGLALGVLPDAAASLARRSVLVALVHHPLALESGLSAEAAAALHRSEHAALAEAQHVVVTSHYTGRLLSADYGVAAERITAILPGVRPIEEMDIGRRLQPQRSSAAIRLLSVGTLSPRKGHDVLLLALSTLKDLDWQLPIAGADTRDPDAARQIRKMIHTHDLGARVTLTGAVGSHELARFYAEADVFVLASRFEGYGMAYAEALQWGLPIIGTSAGAIPETVPPTAGVLVPPDDPGPLSSALRQFVIDPQLRAKAAGCAREAGCSLPTWETAGGRFSELLERIA